MRLWTPLILITGLVCVASTPTFAASLQVSPILFEMPVGKAAETLKLRNEGQVPLNAQVRIVRWTQINGVEKLDPTTDVVASPPVITVEPGNEQIIRVVRVSKTPVVGEESYRITVDEIPDKANAKPDEVNFVFKYSIPMFFMTQSRGKADLTWGVEKLNDTTVVVAKNSGNRRARIAGLTLKPANGKDFVLGRGLNGYVLSGSIMRWTLPKTFAVGGNGPVIVTARSDEGPINATAQALESARR